MKVLLRFIALPVCFFAFLPSHAQQHTAAAAYGQRLFELLQSRNVQGLDELVPSYDTFINEAYEQYRRQARESGMSEEETEVALNEMRKATVGSGDKPRKQYAELRKNLKKEFSEFLSRGLRKGIVWENIRFTDFKYTPDEIPDFFSSLRNAELLFSYQGKVFSLEVGDLVKLQGKYYSLNIQFDKLFK